MMAVVSTTLENEVDNLGTRARELGRAGTLGWAGCRDRCPARHQRVRERPHDLKG